MAFPQRSFPDGISRPTIAQKVDFYAAKRQIEPIVQLQLGPHFFLVSPVPTTLNDYMVDLTYSTLETLDNKHNAGRFIPVTVLHTYGQCIDQAWVDKRVMEMTAIDDVISDAFIATTVFFGSPNVKGKLDGKYVWMHNGGKDEDEDEGHDDYINAIPDGPYMLKGKAFHKVFKLYPDPFGAFTCGILSGIADLFADFFNYKTEDGHVKPPNIRYHAQENSIPVPSRLYFPEPSEDQPLSGMRIAVKDIFDIRGLTTGLSSEAYKRCYESAKVTAPAIQSLIDQGAVIVGKTKTTQFASGMGARDWIENQSPFNPRGDGYLESDCSSSGGAVGLAAYQWLDYSIGSDTLGSITGPAALCGIYGLRPTHGRLSREGMFPIAPIFDTPGLFSRDIATLRKVASLWMGAQGHEVPRPTRLLCPEGAFEGYSAARIEVMNNFIQEFETGLHIEMERVNMEEEWSGSKSANASAHLGALESFLEPVLPHIQLHGSYQNTESFRNLYRSKFDCDPYVEPLVRYKWDLGSKITDEELADAHAKRQIFHAFLNDTIFTEGTVMLLPCGPTDVAYRDEYPGTLEDSGKRWQGFGVPNTIYSVLGGLPCVSFPVGQSKYKSRNTGKDEYQPVSLMLLGPAGSDCYLMDLIKYVVRVRGLPEGVKTGRVAFTE